MAAGIISGVSWFIPIFAFFLVLILVYILIKETKVLGSNEPVIFFLSFIIASFFILEAQLVNFIEVITGWFATLMVVIFFMVLLLMFAGRDFKLEFLTKSKGFAWVLLAVLVILLVTSTSYVFNWVINWTLLREWAMSEWFGFILLVALGFAAYAFIKTKAK